MPALLASGPQLAGLKRPREQLSSGQPSTVPLHQRDSNLPDQPRIKRRLVSGNLRRAEQAGSAASAATCRVGPALEVAKSAPDSESAPAAKQHSRNAPEVHRPAVTATRGPSCDYGSSDRPVAGAAACSPAATAASLAQSAVAGRPKEGALAWLMPRARRAVSKQAVRRHTHSRCREAALLATLFPQNVQQAPPERVNFPDLSQSAGRVSLQYPLWLWASWRKPPHSVTAMMEARVAGQKLRRSSVSG